MYQLCGKVSNLTRGAHRWAPVVALWWMLTK